MNWLLLKGVARATVHWNEQPEALRAALPGTRVHLLDLPGVGTAVERRAPLSVREIVRDLRERLRPEREAASDPWHVLGISLGGMVAIEWLHRHPEDFAAGVALVPSAADLSPPWQRLRPAVLPGYLHSLVTRRIETRERRILETIVNDAALREELIARYSSEAAGCPLPRAACLRQLFAAGRWRAPRRIATPLLLLGSEGDRMVAPSCTRRLAQHLDVPFEMHSRAGHEIGLEDPGWVAARIRDWLAVDGSKPATGV